MMLSRRRMLAEGRIPHLYASREAIVPRPPVPPPPEQPEVQTSATEPAAAPQPLEARPLEARPTAIQMLLRGEHRPPPRREY